MLQYACSAFSPYFWVWRVDRPGWYLLCTTRLTHCSVFILGQPNCCYCCPPGGIRDSFLPSYFQLADFLDSFSFFSFYLQVSVS